MQTSKHYYHYFKKAILFIALIWSSSTLMAQTSSLAGEKHSAMVSKMLPRGNGLSFDASITPDSTGDRFILTIDNPAKNKLSITLYHNISGEVYRKDTEEEVYRNCFDLSNAEDGTYTVRICNGKEKLKKQLEIYTTTRVSRRIAIH